MLVIRLVVLYVHVA